jgi:hypothetical protein
LFKGGIESVGRSHLDYLQGDASQYRFAANRSDHGRARWVTGVDESGDRVRLRQSLSNHLEQLQLEILAQGREASDVAARLCETRNEPRSDRVVQAQHHDGHARREFLRRFRRRDRRYDDRPGLFGEQVPRQVLEAAVIAFRIAGLEHEMLCLDEAFRLKTLPQPFQLVRTHFVARGPTAENRDAERRAAVLCASRERPCSGCAGKQGHENTSLHSIASPARHIN